MTGRFSPTLKQPFKPCKLRYAAGHRNNLLLRSVYCTTAPYPKVMTTFFNGFQDTVVLTVITRPMRLRILLTTTDFQ
ncbi:hypothetical protein V5799_026584 [Amblyomma americanum]|uniref:Uncharacterized protein n=1 Tax=Amblyomma americanum TaxID=6943 RepID=A0AAQ4DI59_AMBAM